VISPTGARNVACRLLADDLPRRWSHVQAVGAKGELVGQLVGGNDGQTLAVAAWLHDVGYSRNLVDTGFHALDGARWLRANAFDDRVAALVAHHSCAWLEAEERSLTRELEVFDREETAVADALCFCDMTTGPDGQTVSAPVRLREIRERYGAHHLVTRFIDRAEAEILGAVARTCERLPELRVLQPR
jgi:HD superfamily phosphodiesterase